MADNKPIRILIIHGPNLDLLGQRETDIYGHKSLAEINESIARCAKTLEAEVDFFQSSSEGAIVQKIGEARTEFQGIVINPAAYTHTSVAIRDAIAAINLPTVEVHLSNVDAREEFRRHSYLAPVCLGRISGFGANSYHLGLHGLVRHLRKDRHT